MQIRLIQVNHKGGIHYFIVDVHTLTQFDQARESGTAVPNVTTKRSFTSRNKAKAWCRTVGIQTSPKSIWLAWLGELPIVAQVG